ncbi:hypothetical protein NQ317_010349 [Molorchus minor]|uniref:Uncharacterized protein n=1 Tax=Molorchus minor TaxID=1323400 RepID=A0ABQ9JVV9_9CUCU|nr:hypothetical protein NQ317_010349 [Molorchus minor]
MSPLCLAQPIDWQRISQEHQGLIRNVIECLDAKQYLSNRSVEPSSILSVDDESIWFNLVIINLIRSYI